VTARTKRTLYVAVLVAVALVSVLRLVRTVRHDDVEGAVVVLGVVLALAIVAAVLAATARRAGSLAAHVARQRPGSLVVPGFTTAEMPQLAAHLGASARGWLPMGGSPVAIALTPAGYEVWGRKDAAPRWVVRRAPDGVTAGRGVYGARQVGAVWLHDGAAAAAFVPAYRPLRATGGFVGSDVERAVAELSGRGVALTQGR
jgi:hypothetical protein